MVFKIREIPESSLPAREIVSSGEKNELERTLLALRDSHVSSAVSVIPNKDCDQIHRRTASDQLSSSPGNAAEKKRGLFKSWFRRSNTAGNGASQTECFIDKNSPELSSSSRKLVMIRDKLGQGRLYHKETTHGVVVHPRLGSVPLESWREISLNRQIIVLPTKAVTALTGENISTTNHGDCAKYRPLFGDGGEEGGKLKPVAASTSVNILGLQNITVHLSLQDIFGLGLMLRFLRDLYQSHVNWIESLKPPAVKWIIILWEISVISVLLWQLVLIIGWAGHSWSLFNSLLIDGVHSIEFLGYGIHRIINGLANWMIK